MYVEAIVIPIEQNNNMKKDAAIAYLRKHECIAFLWSNHKKFQLLAFGTVDAFFVSVRYAPARLISMMNKFFILKRKFDHLYMR